MAINPLHGLHPSSAARCLFGYLHRRGGCVRLGPLLQGLGMDRRVLADAIMDLSERYWITVVWRKAAPGSDETEDRPLTDIRRLCTTRFGRRKYRSSRRAD
jgi:hypothetical protein